MNQKTKIAATILAICLGVGLATASIVFYLGTIPGTVQVQEGISWNPANFAVVMYTGETATQTITVSNAANVTLTVNIAVSVSDSSNITASAPATLDVPALSSATFDVTVTSFAYSTPGTYAVEVSLTR